MVRHLFVPKRRESMNTYLEKQAEVEHKWFLVDATAKPAGRLASEIAKVLRGKHKITYTPHMDLGDFVIVVNADKVALTGGKEDKKIYKHYTGFPSGLKEFTAKQIRERNPGRIIEQAVHGMLPRTKLSRHQLTRLKVYTGSEHPHQAQNPESIELL